MNPQQRRRATLSFLAGFVLTILGFVIARHWSVSLLLLIRAEEWTAVALAVVGVWLGVHYALDNRRDLAFYRRRGWNGFAELAGKQGVRSGFAKAGLHAILSVLPAISLMTIPPVSRYADAIVFFLALGIAQGLVIVAQALNYRDRVRLRRKLAVEQPAEG